MSIFLAVSFLLVLLWVVHWIWWRIALPRRQRPVLLMIFLFGGILLSPVARLFVQQLGFGELTVIQWLNVALVVISVTLAYVVAYSAVEADSPTLSLVRHIAAAGSGGLREEELREFMAKRPFLGARLTALLQEEMIREKGYKITLANHPYVLFRFVVWHRVKVLRIDSHGG